MRIERKHEKRDIREAFFPVSEAPLKYGLGGKEGLGGGTCGTKPDATVNATVSATVNDLIFEAIKNHPGIRRPGLLELLPMVKRGTLTRKLAELAGRIEFRGSPKTGGYYPKENRPSGAAP